MLVRVRGFVRGRWVLSKTYCMDCQQRGRAGKAGLDLSDSNRRKQIPEARLKK